MDGERVDAVLQALGRWGRWQGLQAACLALTYIPLAFHYTSIVFIGHEPSYRCTVSNESDAWPHVTNGSDAAVYKQCRLPGASGNTSTTCPGHFRYDRPRYISIASEWNLVCESAYLVQLSQTALSLGNVLGYAIFPLADKYGRKKTLVACHWVMFLTSATTAFSPNILCFIILKFVGGFFIPAVNVIMCLMLLELFPVSQRARVAMVSKFLWAGGVMALSLVAYLFRNTSWRYLQLCLSSSFLLVVAHTFITEESIPWLFVVNRRKDAVAIVKKAAKFNNISFSDKVLPLLDGLNFGSIIIMSSKQELQPDAKANSNGRILAVTNNIVEKLREPILADTHNVAENPIEQVLADTDNVVGNPSEQILADNDNVVKNRNGGIPNEILGAVENNILDSVVTPEDSTGDDPSRHNLAQVQFNSKTRDKDESQTMLAKEEEIGKAKLSDLFRHKTLRKYVFISTYVMTVDIIMYYGLLLMASSLAGDRFINVLLSGAVEIPAFALCMLVLDRFGRKVCLFGFHVWSGGMLVLAIIVSITKGPELLVTAFATLGKFGSCGTLIVSFLHNSEIIPTNLRAWGMGVSGSIANLGGLLAPFSSYLIQFGVWIPGTVFAACCGTVLILLVFLPETRGRQLPQTVADLDRWAAKKRRRGHDEENWTRPTDTNWRRLPCLK